MLVNVSGFRNKFFLGFDSVGRPPTPVSRSLTSAVIVLPKSREFWFCIPCREFRIIHGSWVKETRRNRLCGSNLWISNRDKSLICHNYKLLLFFRTHYTANSVIGVTHGLTFEKETITRTKKKWDHVVQWFAGCGRLPGSCTEHRFLIHRCGEPMLYFILLN